MNATRPQSRSTGAKKPISRDADLEAFRDITDDVIESDFVPFACLYDASTIATKNGELVQIIKITGLGYESDSPANLRAAIREAIRQHIPDETYAIWLHTLRRRKSLVAPTKFPDPFSSGIDAAWRDLHPASASFVNELYISIVKAGQDASLSNFNGLLKSLIPSRDLAQRSHYLDRALATLSETTGRMLRLLQPFGARLLTVVERDGAYYGEHIEFLEKLINLEERPMPVPMQDLSHVLTSGDITFGYNTMEVRTAEGKRRFACLLTVKEYKESTLAGIDKFLDIPCELIVSQCFDFISDDAARTSYETQARYLNISGDTELAQWLEIDRLMQPGNARARTFGEQQTTLFLIAPSIKQLEQNVLMTKKVLSKLGIVSLREDLRMEECYWAQLPSNFPFISRKHSVDTDHLAGFVSLQSQPIGNATGSPWGAPISLFTTVQDAPYFFNFHRDQSAHTLLLGRPKTGRTTLAHFLLAQARKLPLRIWYLDCHGRGEPVMAAMGATTATPGTAQLRLNPFAMADTPANREFLAIWISTLIDPEGKQLNRATLGFFQSLVDALMKQPPAQRRLSTLLPMVREADAMLATKLQCYCAGGQYGELFDMPEDHFSVGALTLWNLHRWVEDAATRVPLASYLLHRMTMALDGTPTLIVLDEGFSLLNNPLFGMRSPAWLDYLSQKNAAALVMTDCIEQSGALPFAAGISSKAASIFAMPDEEPAAEYMMGLGLSEADVNTLAHINPAGHHMLLKRGDQSSVLRMDLSSLGPLLVTLSGRAAPIPLKSAADLLSELMGYNTLAGATA